MLLLIDYIQGSLGRCCFREGSPAGRVERAHGPSGGPTLPSEEKSGMWTLWWISTTWMRRLTAFGRRWSVWITFVSIKLKKRMVGSQAEGTAGTHSVMKEWYCVLPISFRTSIRNDFTSSGDQPNPCVKTGIVSPSRISSQFCVIKWPKRCNFFPG